MKQVTQQSTFASRLIEKVSSEICNLTDQYFEFFTQLTGWTEQKQELDYEYREHKQATTIRKTGWFFLLFVLLPAVGVFDYSSIALFIDYLASTSGGAVGTVIKFTGWMFFLLFELGVGWLLLYSKGKPAMRLVAILLAVAITIIPCYLIYTTYSITPNKTALLYHKTIALMAVSIVLHTLLFFVISEVWAGINYLVYTVKNRALTKKAPQQNMKGTRKELLKLYPDFDNYIQREHPENMASLIHNRAWYVKGKLQNGDTNDDYDLSDYNASTSYAPQSPQPASSNGTYKYTVNQKSW